MKSRMGFEGSYGALCVADCSVVSVGGSGRWGGGVLGRQLLRSGTSVGANYREACRARSIAEFVSKMEGGLQEVDESAYWIELLVSARTVSAGKVAELIGETEELISIFVSSIRTAKQRRRA